MAHTQTVDAFTMQHLNAWLRDAVIYAPALDAVRDAMLAVVADDPDVIELGWPRVYDRADGWTVEQAIGARLKVFTSGPCVPVCELCKPERGDSTMSTKLDAFTRAYLHAAAFTDDPDPGQGEYPEPAIEDFDPGFLQSAIGDCARFQADHGSLFEGEEEHAGRDFWFTRNGHGCGFWDGDWPEDIGETLTRAAKQYNEVCGVFADGREFADVDE
jgi:hypothetical protein